MNGYNRYPIVTGLAIRSESSDERLLIIQRRICEKLDYYCSYNLSREEDYAFNVLFDLSQEFESVEDFYRICVTIPKSFFNLESSIFILDESDVLVEVCDSRLLTPQVKDEQYNHTSPPVLFEVTTALGDSLFIPIYGKGEHNDTNTYIPNGRIIGLLKINHFTEITEHRKLFFKKYANRIGFALHNKIIEKKMPNT